MKLIDIITQARDEYQNNRDEKNERIDNIRKQYARQVDELHKEFKEKLRQLAIDKDKEVEQAKRDFNTKSRSKALSILEPIFNLFWARKLKTKEGHRVLQFKHLDMSNNLHYNLASSGCNKIFRSKSIPLEYAANIYALDKYETCDESIMQLIRLANL